ncbi:PAS domain S-box protein [Chloroflexota bacterium]
MNSSRKYRRTASESMDVSATIPAEMAPIKTEAELLAIFQDSPIIMVLVDEDRQIRRANRRMLDFTGRQHNEIMGLRVGEVIRCIYAADDPKGCGFGVNCESCIARNVVLDTFKAGKTYHRVEAPIRIYRGEGILDLHILVSTSLAKVAGQNMVLVYLEDVTRFKKAEEALQESERRYRDLYEEAPNAYFSVGTDGCIKQANRSASELLGYRPDELMGKAVFNMYADTPAGKTKAQEVFKRFLSGEDINDEELEMHRADGSKLWVSLSVRPVRNKEGQVVTSRSVVVDITERKRLDELKDEFIGLVSHELRIPLTVIIGAVNTALSEGSRLSPEEMRQLLQDAALEAESLSHLLENMLELSRARADRLVLYTEPVSIKNMAQNVVEKVRRQFSGHRFLIKVPRGIPSISADPLRVERVLYNLLENAAKYSPRGGEIGLIVRREKGYVVVGVADQGIGISPHDQAKLFGPFQRLEQPGQEAIKGAGLGLLVCRRLVEAHGGQIWVESEPGYGATFFFTLPV